MENYHPSQAPSAEEWLELDESIRIDLVREFHETAGIEFEEGAENTHSVIHVVVENKLALKEEVVLAALSKLTRQGLIRHEAIHAIGAIIAEDMFEIVKNSREHDAKKYRRRLDKLTAKRWRKGKW